MSQSGSKVLIVVVGPTAVGKTAVAIALAKRFSSEIVSADSRQLYRELTIGTAKPSVAELAEARHHFIDSHSILDDYDAAAYGDDALAKINGLFDRHEVVILCGGSGLYVKAVLEGFDDIPEIDPIIRDELVHSYESQGIVWLQEKLKEFDPDAMADIDQHNPHRLIRALEVRLGTGMSIRVFQRREKRNLPFKVIKVGLELPRERLYARIDARMDEMITAGLFEEARELISFRGHNALQTVGYREIFDYFDGVYDRDEAIRLLKRNSRRYAKRQLTWFKRDNEIRWFSPDDFDNIVRWIEEMRSKT